jgi:ABC-type methionine transport system ATPase subunit
MGPSGSGKSTLLHCIAGLDSLTSGQAFIGDVELGALSERRLTRLRRDRIGFVFQAFNLVPTLTARENIVLPIRLAGRDPDPAVVADVDNCATNAVVWRTMESMSRTVSMAPTLATPLESGRWRGGHRRSTRTARRSTEEVEIVEASGRTGLAELEVRIGVRGRVGGGAARALARDPASIPNTPNIDRFDRELSAE